jgi:hypothetical protein
MSVFGLATFLGNGIRFKSTPSDTNYVALLTTSNPASAISFKLPVAYPSVSGYALTCDTSGNFSFSAVGGGSVTSVGLSLSSLSWLSIAGSPVTANGTLALSATTGLSANQVLATPNGSAGAVGLRSLVAADIPQTLTHVYITDFDTQVRTSRLDQMTAPTASVSFNSQKLTNLLDGTALQDAASWGQVQALFTGQDNKGSVRVATTATLSLTGSTATTITKSGGLPSTLDGVTLNSGDLILVKNETGAGATGALCNGLYVYAAGTTWTRATNATTNAEVTSGLQVFVSEGTANNGTFWVLTTANPITLGTTLLTFTQFGAIPSYTAGNGLQLVGSQFSVLGTTNRIAVSGSGVDISASYVGQTSITTLGTITTGTWTGTAIAIANGGTGATTAAGARTNLSAAGIYKTSFTNASLSSGLLTVTHGLGQQYGSCVITDNNNLQIFPDNVTFSNTTSWTVDLTSFGTLTGTWNVVAVA